MRDDLSLHIIYGARVQTHDFVLYALSGSSCYVRSDINRVAHEMIHLLLYGTIGDRQSFFLPEAATWEDKVMNIDVGEPGHVKMK